MFYCFPVNIKSEGRLKAYQEGRTLFRHFLHVPLEEKQYKWLVIVRNSGAPWVRKFVIYACQKFWFCKNRAYIRPGWNFAFQAPARFGGKPLVQPKKYTFYQNSGRTVGHLCLWLGNEHGWYFCEEFAPRPEGRTTWWRLCLRNRSVLSQSKRW